MFQSVFLILLSSCLQCLGLCLLSWTLGKTGEVGSDGDKGRPLERKTKPSDLPHQEWGAHRPVLANSPPCQHGQGFAQQGVRIPGAAASRQQCWRLGSVWMWRLKAQGDALLAWGLLFSAFPSVDTSTRSFTFARRKEVKVAPLFSAPNQLPLPETVGPVGGCFGGVFLS